IFSSGIHSQFITTLIHLISQLAHVGLALFFTLQWHSMTSVCPPLGHSLTSIFGALTAIYSTLSTAKGYALLTHFCNEPWAKRTLSFLSMITSSAYAIIDCVALILLEIEFSGNISFCELNEDEMPLLPSRIFLVLSALINIVVFATSLFIHWRQSRIDAQERSLPSHFESSSSSFSTPSMNPSVSPNPPIISTRLDPSAKLYSPDYFITHNLSK
ncbi:hypothetical protein PMAYCL1PPCAC_02326, partial [Pristionchus mayeri]